jgi:hypothetical protein
VGLLNRPDGTTLVVILAVCIVALLALAAWTFFDWRRDSLPRWARGSADEAYPDELPPVSVANRIGGPVEPEPQPEPGVDPVESVTVVPASTRTTTKTATAKKTPAKRTPAKKTPAKRTPVKGTARSRGKSSPQD